MFSCEFAKYLRTPFLQNTSALYNIIEITLRHGCSPANLLHVFRASLHKNTSGGLLLVIHIKKNFKIELYVNSQLFLLYNVHKRTNFSSFYHVKMRGVLRKYVFLEILQNSQENTCARVSFLIKMQTSACNFFKKETLGQVFACEFR